MLERARHACLGALAAAIPSTALAQGPCGVWRVDSPTSALFARPMDVDVARHVVSRVGALNRDIEIRRRDSATGAWSLEATLKPPFAGGFFATMLDLDGDRLAVLSVGPGGHPLYVYRATPAGWVLEQHVATIPPLVGGGPFGLHLRGTVLHVRGDLGVSVFEFDPLSTTWRLTQVVFAPGNPMGFGEDTDFDGRTLVVSDRIANRAVVYRRTVQGQYEHVQDLTSAHSAVPRFGAQVELEDGLIVVAREPGPSEGRVEVFRFVPSSGTWASGPALQDPLPSHIAPGQPLGFGAQLVLSRGTLVVSSPDARRPGSNAADGAVHLFKLEPRNNIFRLERSLVANSPSNPFVGQRFGVTLAFDSGLLAAATQATGDRHDGQYVFVPGTTDCDADNVPDACEILVGSAYDDNRNGFVDTCELSGVRYCTPGVTNSAGTAARMNVFGEPRTLLFYLDLVAGGLPPGAVGHFIASQGSGVVLDPAMWNGALCVGGAPLATNVGGPRVAGLDGSFAVNYNRPQLPVSGGLVPILPGQTWHFQCWYQDLGATPSSSYSDAVAVTFTFL